MSYTDTDTMLDVQRDIEFRMRDEGIRKAMKNIEHHRENNAEAATSYGHQMMVHGLAKFTEGVRDYMENDPRKGGHAAKARALLLGGKPEVVAYVFMKAIINTISNKRMTLQHAVVSAAQMIEDEYMLEDLRQQDKALCKRMVDAANKRTGYLRRMAINSALNDEAMKGKIDRWAAWSKDSLFKIGTKLLNILIDTVGLVEIVTESRGKNNTIKRLVATKETMEWIEQRTNKLGLTAPTYKPLVIPPRDWTYENLENGIYYTYSCRPVKLVKTNNRRYFEELRNTDIDVVLAGVNAMQRTAWTINQPILNLINELWEAGAQWCPSIPSRYNEEEPAPLEDYENATVQEKAAHVSELMRVRVANREARAKRISFNAMLDVALEYQNYPEFYIGYNLDFRGRVYAVPAFNGMGPDEMKAVMQFAEGKPLGKDGVRYLAIHLANTGDFDKVSKKSMEERVQWTMDNEQLIRDVVSNPWENRAWAEADKPLQFLAACMDWVGYLENGEDHVSYLPTAWDGSCSGLQHLSMAMKCTSTAKNVNILPSEQPQDVYQIVADKVVARLREDAAQPFEHWGEPVLNNMGIRVPNYTELAQEWLKFGFGRKQAKRSVMTYSYGSKQFGFREQVVEDTMRPLKRECAKTGQEFPFSYDDGYRAASYIARLLWDAVVDSVKRPAQLMDWLTESASMVAKTKYMMPDGSEQTMPVRWTTPLGLPVVQSYFNTDKRRVKTHMAGSLIYMTLNENTDQICSRKSAQGMSPNWVHSCDAAHLQLSVARAEEEGITSFSMIHDSFGCHACDAGKFIGIIKRSMVEMYDNSDVVHDLYLELRSQLKPEQVEDLPLPPAKGTLEYIDTVMSLYSFA